MSKKNAPFGFPFRVFGVVRGSSFCRPDGKLRISGTQRRPAALFGEDAGLDTQLDTEKLKANQTKSNPKKNQGGKGGVDHEKC
jgi:hypothetical protein